MRGSLVEKYATAKQRTNMSRQTYESRTIDMLNRKSRIQVTFYEAKKRKFRTIEIDACRLEIAMTDCEASFEFARSFGRLVTVA